MNTILALAFSGLLSTASPGKTTSDDPARESSTYVVTDKLALWLTDGGKLKLTLAQQPGIATVEIRNATQTLYRNNLPKGQVVHQSFDLSAMEEGTYEVRVTTGKQVTTKTIQIEYRSERTIKLS